MSYSRETKHVIEKAMALSERLQLLINSNDRQYIIRSHRDPLAFMYWNIVFEHHQGLIFLLHNDYLAPAFALLRILQEAVCRSFLAMFGTERQAAAITNGTYQTDFEAVGRQIDEKLESGPLVQARMKDTIKALHGFTHGGPHQLTRQFRKARDGMEVISSYSDEEVRGLVNETIPPVGITAAFTTEFFELASENSLALEMVNEFVQSTAHPI
jgi:hypothetical protein